MGEKVYIKKCEEYDRAAMKELVREGMDALGFKPSGNVFVKPNVVFASKPDVFGTHSYTPTSLIGASILGQYRAVSGTPFIFKVITNQQDKSLHHPLFFHHASPINLWPEGSSEEEKPGEFCHWPPLTYTLLPVRGSIGDAL